MFNFDMYICGPRANHLDSPDVRVKRRGTESDNQNNLELMEYFWNISFFEPTLFGKVKVLQAIIRRDSAAATLTQCEQAVWWSQVVGSGPWWYR